MTNDTMQKHKDVLLELFEEFDRVCKKHDIPYILFCGTALGAIRHKGFIPWDDDIDVSMLRHDYERFLEVAPKELKEQYYLQAEYSKHWPAHISKLRKNNTTCLEKFHPKDKKMHQGIYIDIFPCDNASDKEWICKLQYYASRVVIAKTLFARGYETDSFIKKAFMLFCSLLPLKPFRNFAMRKKEGKSNRVHTFLACTSRYKTGIYKRSWFQDTMETDFEHLKATVSSHYDELLTTLYGDYMKIPKEEDRKCKVHAILIDTERDFSEYENYRDGMTFDGYTRNIH